MIKAASAPRVGSREWERVRVRGLLDSALRVPALAAVSRGALVEKAGHRQRHRASFTNGRGGIGVKWDPNIFQIEAGGRISCPCPTVTSALAFLKDSIR